VTVSDEDLARMERNLKQAFEDVSGHFEYLKRHNGSYSGGYPEYRETAAQLAAVSGAWLEVSREQAARAEEADSGMKRPLAKPLNSPKSR